MNIVIPYLTLLCPATDYRLIDMGKKKKRGEGLSTSVSTNPYETLTLTATGTDQESLPSFSEARQDSNFVGLKNQSVACFILIADVL